MFKSLYRKPHFTFENRSGQSHLFGLPSQKFLIYILQKKKKITKLSTENILKQLQKIF